MCIYDSTGKLSPEFYLSNILVKLSILYFPTRTIIQKAR